MALTPTPGHTYLLCIPDLGGQARGWWWVMLSQSCMCSVLTPHLQHEENSYLLSLYCKDEKQEWGRVYNILIFTNNFQVYFF